MAQTVLVTGANSGIGPPTVLDPARPGSHPTGPALQPVRERARPGYHPVGSVRSEAKAVTVKEAARAAGVTVDTVQLDVTDADACREAVAGLELYGLVNNAGEGGPGAGGGR